MRLRTSARRRCRLVAAVRRAAGRQRRGGRPLARTLAVMGLLAVVCAAAPPRAAAAPAAPCDPVQDWDCIPEPEPAQPPGSTPQAPPEETEPPEVDGPGGFAGWIFDGILSAINAFFSDLASAALNPLLELLGQSLLTTPTPDELPQVHELWSNSWHIVVTGYSVLVMAAGLVVMFHQTLQTQYSAREIAPRLAVGFLAAFLSLWVATRLIVLANALTQAVMSSGVEAEGAANVLAVMVISHLATGGIFTVFLGLAVAVFLVAILVSYVVRVSLVVIMLIGAPLALACHALPQLEGVARWWWRTFAALLAIQVAQSLTLVTALNVFLGEDAFALFGSADAGLTSLTTALALMFILWKIPGWILASTGFSRGRRGIVGSAARAFVAYRAFGALRGRGGPRRAAAPRGPGAGRPWQGRGAAPAAPAAQAGAARVPRPGGRPRGAAVPPLPPRRPPGTPLFQQPVPGAPQLRPRRAAGPPRMPVFQAPAAGQPVLPRQAAGPPAPPVFRAPQAGQPAAARPLPQAQQAPRPAAWPRFQQPRTQPMPPPARPPAPRPPAQNAFQSPAPPTGNLPLPPRRRPPAPPVFRPPTPPRRRDT